VLLVGKKKNRRRSYRNLSWSRHCPSQGYANSRADSHAHGRPDAYRNSGTDPTPTATPIPLLNFANVRTVGSQPSQIQIVFALRDESGRSLLLPADELHDATRIFERASVDQEWEEIDYAETNYFVYTAENLELEVVFVLDFTNSMATARGLATDEAGPMRCSLPSSRP